MTTGKVLLIVVYAEGFNPSIRRDLTSTKESTAGLSSMAPKRLGKFQNCALCAFESCVCIQLLVCRCGAGGGAASTRCSACRQVTGAGIRCTRCGQLLDAQMRALRSQIDGAGTALQLVSSGGRSLLNQPNRPGDKNLVVAGVLGLLGPWGWFYSAPLREAGTATAAFLLAYWLIPHIILYPLMSLMLPVSAMVGVLYAWKHNRQGSPSSLFIDDSESR